MAHDVFISYSSVNKITANAICHALEQSGVRCWIAPRDIPAGSQYGEQITVGIRECKVFLLVYSDEVNRSIPVQKELERAVLGYKKTIVPYKIEDVPMNDNIEFFLGDVHWIHAHPNDTEFINLIIAIKKVLGMDVSEPQIPASSGGQTEEAPTPYVPASDAKIIPVKPSPPKNKKPKNDLSDFEKEINRRKSIKKAKKIIAIAGASAVCLLILFIVLSVFLNKDNPVPSGNNPNSKIDISNESINDYLNYKINDGEITITGFKTGYYAKNLVIPEMFGEYPIVAIGDGAFGYSAAGLETVVLPAGIKSVGNSAFAAETLTSITFGAGLEMLGESVFSGCGKIKEIALPNGVISIGEKAFNNCAELEKVVMPNSVTQIGKRAFNGCAKLKDIALPGGLTSVEEWLFSECKALESIVIPGQCAFIDDWAFYQCISLKTVKIHPGIETILGSPFSGCDNLEELWLPPSITSIPTGYMLASRDKLKTIYVEKGSYAETFCNENNLSLSVKYKDFSSVTDE